MNSRGVAGEPRSFSLPFKTSTRQESNHHRLSKPPYPALNSAGRNSSRLRGVQRLGLSEVKPLELLLPFHSGVLILCHRRTRRCGERHFVLGRAGRSRAGCVFSFSSITHPKVVCQLRQMSRFPARGIHWSARTAGSASVFVVVHEAETGRKLNVELAQGELEIGVIDVIRAKLYRCDFRKIKNEVLLYQVNVAFSARDPSQRSSFRALNSGRQTFMKQ